METELREAVLAAARRPEVGQAVSAVYAALAHAIDIRRPMCTTSGRCCRFEEYGHRLYVTTMELAKFVSDVALPKTHAIAARGPDSGLRSADARRPNLLPILPKNNPPPELGCRFQIDGLCGVHDIRPFGCRIFFCDATSTEWQHDMYERLHGQLRQMHDALNVPYHYVEWRFALKVCL